MMLNSIFSKYKKLSVTKKAGIWFIICSFLQKGISFLTTPIFTRIMSTEDFGLTTIFNTWLSILMIFATLNLSGSVYNRGLVDYDQKKFTSVIQTISIVFSFVMMLIFVIFHHFISSITNLNDTLLILMALYFMIYPAFNIWSVKERFNFRYKKLVLMSILSTIFSALFGIVAVLLFKNKGEAKIIGSTIILILIAFPFLIKNLTEGKTFFDKKMWKYSLVFALPLIPHYLSNLILNQSDKIMINYFCGASDVALYGVAYSIGSLVLVLIDALNSTLTPWRYQTLKKKEYKTLNDNSLKILLFVALVVVISNMFGPELLYIFASKKYSSAIWVIPPVMLSVYFIFLYNTFSCIEFYYLQTKFMMIASTMSAILNIVLNIIFINKYGYIACAYTTLICYAFYSIVHYIYMKSICKSKMDNVNIYDIKKIFLISIACCILTLCFTFTYNYFVIRYSLVLIILILIFINKNKLIKLFKELKS